MLYVTRIFILQWIAFMFGWDEEEYQKMFPMQEKQSSVSFFII